MKKNVSKYVLVVLLLIITIFVLWLGANVFLLSKFYMAKTERSFEQVFDHLDYVIEEYGVYSGEFLDAFVSDAETYNCDILILDQNMDVIASNAADSDAMLRQLYEYAFHIKDDQPQRYIKKTEQYIIATSHDVREQVSHVDLCGTLSTGNLVLIRSAVSGMQENARLAKVFTAYVGSVAVIVSLILVYFIVKNMTLSTELKRRTEMDEMRKEFISNVSHELKTPIAIIQGYAEGLTDCVNDDDESRAYYCEVITDEAQKMNRLVKSLLDLNEIEFGNSILVKENFNIIELIRTCVQSVDPLIKQQNVSVEYTMPDEVMIYSDEFSVETVLKNYLSNAIHYVSGDPKRIVVSVSEKDKNGRVRVTVFNTGDKIPEESLDKIWAKFYKVDKARTREYGGSGVGLSIVKATMDSLGEKYGVRNTDEGVEFWFEAEIGKV